MTVLVAAASKHGATDEIAARIGAVLAAHGVEVDVQKLQAVSELGGYEAVVLGSGIYLGTWLKEARRFVEVHAAELAQRPTWLFASGSIVGDPPVGDDPNAMGAGLAEWLVATTQARELKVFAGKLDLAGWAWPRGRRCAWPMRVRATTATGRRSMTGQPRSRSSSSRAASMPAALRHAPDVAGVGGASRSAAVEKQVHKGGQRRAGNRTLRQHHDLQA